MDAQELLKDWPELAKANAVRVLASPAWRLETRYAGKPAVLKRVDSEAGGANAISLSVTFDDVPRIVTFAPSPIFPDLWQLREHLKALPGEVLLALVEKECGALFQFFEDGSRQSFAIAGLSEQPAAGYSFKLSVEGGDIHFTVELSSTVEQQLGQLSNLDATHESIRALTREVTACHAVLPLTDEEAIALQVGECLVLPEAAAPAWLLEVPTDQCARVIAPQSRRVTFAELADDALGAVPSTDTVKIVRGGKIIASGVFARLGEAKVVKLTSLT